MTLQEVANRYSIGKALAIQILHEKIGMSKVSARWEPKYLTEDQKASRVTIAKEHLRHFNHDENKFLTILSLEMKCWFILLNLNQKLSKSSGNELVSHLPRCLTCLHLLAM